MYNLRRRSVQVLCGRALVECIEHLCGWEDSLFPTRVHAFSSFGRTIRTSLVERGGGGGLVGEIPAFHDFKPAP